MLRDPALSAPSFLLSLEPLPVSAPWTFLPVPPAPGPTLQRHIVLQSLATRLQTPSLLLAHCLTEARFPPSRLWCARLIILPVCCVAFRKHVRMRDARWTLCPVTAAPKKGGLPFLSRGCRLLAGAANPGQGLCCRSASFHKSLRFGYLTVDMSPEDAVFPKSQEANKLLQLKNESIY